MDECVLIGASIVNRYHRYLFLIYECRGPGAIESGSIVDLKSKVTEFVIKSKETSHLSRHFKVT